MLKKALRFTLKLIVFSLVALIIFGLLVASGLFGELPTKDQLSNIKNNVATEVYSADGVLIGKYFIQERSSIKFDQISEHVVNALIATEDARFYSHHGIDPRSLVRVLIKTIILQDRSGGGGSTITQQLIKNIFPRENHGIWTIPVAKMKESILAYRIENIYSKEEILTLYVNTVPFGDNVFGIETASKRFFNKASKNLSLEEAAVLIGMLKANYTYNPRLFPEKSLSRRNVVLSQMYKYEFISEEIFESTKNKPLKIDYNSTKLRSSSAAYFKEQLRKQLEEWIKLNPKSDGSHYNIYTDGLKIYTTLDSRIQRYAERAMKNHMKDLQKTFDTHWNKSKPWDTEPSILKSALHRMPEYTRQKESGRTETQIYQSLGKKKPTAVFSWEDDKERNLSSLDSLKHYLKILHAGVIAMDPNNGDIKAWVGGIDFSHFKYDHAAKATKRQVGSTFKPFVYSTALESGFDPCRHISASRLIYTDMKDWTPNNADAEENVLKYSYKGALAKSVNTVAVKVMEEAGIEETIEFANSLGIESEIPELPSIALGTPSISLLEMTQAYSAYANLGRKVEPRFITKIADTNGDVIVEFSSPDSERVMTEETAMMLTEMMREVVMTGTGNRLRWKYNLSNNLAGKTGTTQSNADGWFIGYNPEIVIGVWVGADDPRVRFRSTSLGSGANTALPIFGKIFQQINDDPNLSTISGARFKKTSQAVREKLSCADIKEDKNFIQNLLGIKKTEKIKEKKFGEKKKGFFQKVGDLFKGKKKKD